MPEEALGKQVQCPSCRTTFLAQAQAAEPRERPVPAALDVKPAQTVDAPQAAPEMAAPQLSLDDEDEGPVIPAGQLPPPPLSLRPVLLEAELGDDPPRPSSGGMTRCRSCRELTPRNAAYCRHCGTEIESYRDRDRDDPGVRGGLRRDCEPHRGSLILALGVIGLVASFLYIFAIVGLPLSIAAWSMAETDLKKMLNRDMDPEGRPNTQAGKVCGIFGTLIGTLWVMVFCCIGFDIFLR
jgi:hypothetical protein